ncbi:MAG: hypothetical protein JNK05_19685 [Myxococcales bacterium]|nr:hypothetical protein [Myxococcales bacterium]
MVSASQRARECRATTSEGAFVRGLRDSGTTRGTASSVQRASSAYGNARTRATERRMAKP